MTRRPLPHVMAAMSAAPSTIAASTTWPWPERRASTNAATTPRANSIPPPPKSPRKFTGGTGASPAGPIMRQRAGQRDVVDVVAGLGGVGALLAPARHPAVHQLGVPGQAYVRSDAEPFGHPWAETLGQHVGRSPPAAVRPRPLRAT